MIVMTVTRFVGGTGSEKHWAAKIKAMHDQGGCLKRDNSRCLMERQ